MNKINNNGYLVIKNKQKVCPFCSDGAYCGEWCALWVENSRFIDNHPDKEPEELPVISLSCVCQPIDYNIDKDERKKG